jgi:O-antigen biosynthesis protein
MRYVVAWHRPPGGFLSALPPYCGEERDDVVRLPSTERRLLVRTLRRPALVERVERDLHLRRLNERMSAPFSPQSKTETRGDAFRFEPTRVLEIELRSPLEPVPSRLPSGHRHTRALALVRLHSRPLGRVELELGSIGLSPEECAARIWDALGPQINQHLVSDDLAPVAELSADGLADTSHPACIDVRECALEAAPFASVVIGTRERSESLSACLDSLLELEYPSYEIIVVDNAPRTSATRDMLALRYGGRVSPEIRYLREDRSYADACNRGLVEARGAIVAFTDDDVVVDRWWLLELARSFDSDRIACVTGMILPAELETAPQAWLEQYGGFSKGFRERHFDLDDNRPPDKLFPYAAGMFGSGANMAFRADVLRQLRGFDPAAAPPLLPYGCEDIAAFLDVITAGYVLAYQPAALVYHHHHRDYASLRNQAYRYGLGLGAFVTKMALDRPARLIDLVTRLPYGLAHLLSPRSRKNASKRSDYPRALTWIERKGILNGPAAYLRARWKTRRFERPAPRLVRPH